MKAAGGAGGAEMAATGGAQARAAPGDAALVEKISVYSNGYPAALKQIFDPPQTLYLRGAPPVAEGVFVAIVGTRTPSAYGLKTAYAIASEVSRRGGVVVSGLAFGIDAICHKAATDMKKPTVAVIASGINNITPRSNRPLAEEIIKNGGSVISEFREDGPSMKYRFLRRNRIISGLCAATVVVEAGDKSGALITARHAFEQNRDVYALAGDIDRAEGAGCRKLIENEMAKPVFSVSGLMRDLGLGYSGLLPASMDTDCITVLKILREMTPGGKDGERGGGRLGWDDYRGQRGWAGSGRGGGRIKTTSDNISLLSGLPAGPVMAALTILEMNGLVKKNPDGNWLYDGPLNVD